MNSKGKGLISLVGMIVVTVVLIPGSEKLNGILGAMERSSNGIQTTAAGFGGDITVGTVIKDDGTIAKIEIVNCSTETDTIGQLAAPEVAQAIVDAQSLDVDGVAGATITSDAVKAAVEAAITEKGLDISLYKSESVQEDEETSEETEISGESTAYTPGTYESSAQGFAGEIKVRIVVADDGSIENVEILDCSTETPEIGQKAAPEVAQAIVDGQKIEVEAVSGATLTSNAVMEAVSLALSGGEPALEEESEAIDSEAASEEESEAMDSEAASEEENEAMDSEEDTEVSGQTIEGYMPGKYEAAAAGYAGDVKVAVTVSEDGEIQDVEILDCSAESEFKGQKAAPRIAQSIVKAGNTEVNAVTGATITSDAVKAAVEACLMQADGEAAKEKKEEGFTAGRYEAAAAGYAGDIKVAVTVSEDGEIQDVEILDCSAESEFKGQKAAPRIAQSIVKAGNTEVNAVTGATITSDAVKAAVEACLMQAAGEVPESEEISEAETEESSETDIEETGTEAVAETETETETQEETVVETETETETQEETTEAEPVVYEGTAQGYGGEVKVAVTVSEDGEILEVEILDCSSESDYKGQKAAPQVAKNITKSGSIEVNGVTGATITSDAVKAAVKAALENK